MNKVDTCYESVLEFHRLTGAHVASEPFLPPKSSELRLLRNRLLEEEYNEFKLGDENDDLVEIADALGDMVYVIYGMALTYGIPLDKVFAAIHHSNMTKACDTENEAIETVDAYSKKGIKCIYAYNKLVNKFVILRESDNKILKSIKYTPVNLAPILNK